MRKPLLAVVVLALHTLAFGADERLAKEFPLTLTVAESKVDDFTINVDLASRIEGEQLGLAEPILVHVTGTINDESHWWIQCWRENLLGETNPCTQLTAGKYPARWVHNGELLQVAVVTDDGKLEWRFFDVIPKQKDDAPTLSDPVVQAIRYAFQFSMPKGRNLQEYPELVHVYGAATMRLPSGVSLGQTHCTSTTYTQYTTSVNCINAGGRQLYKGYVILDATVDGKRGWTISCDAKWKWSKCAALGPGFYPARWSDEKKRRLSVVVVVDDKPREVTFEAQKLTRPGLPDLTEPAPARPPDQ